MSHPTLGTTAKDQYVANSSPPVSQNDSCAPSSPDNEDRKVNRAETGMVSYKAETGTVSRAETGTVSSDPSDQGSQFQGHAADTWQSTSYMKQQGQVTQKTGERVLRPEQNLYGGPQCQSVSANIYMGEQTEERPAEANERRPCSTGKRPREDNDAHPPPNKILANNHSKTSNFITSNEDDDIAAVWYSNNEQINSMDKFPLDSGPHEIGLHYRPAGVQSKTAHPRQPLIVSGKDRWHLQKKGILTTTIWYRQKLIITKESDETLRCHKLVQKYPELLQFVEHLKETLGPLFNGYHLCDRETRKCVFLIRKDCDLDLIVTA